MLKAYIFDKGEKLFFNKDEGINFDTISIIRDENEISIEPTESEPCTKVVIASMYGNFKDNESLDVSIYGDAYNIIFRKVKEGMSMKLSDYDTNHKIEYMTGILFNKEEVKSLIEILKEMINE